MSLGHSLLHRVSCMEFSTAEKRVIELLLSIAEYDVAGLLHRKSLGELEPAARRLIVFASGWDIAG